MRLMLPFIGPGTPFVLGLVHFVCVRLMSTCLHLVISPRIGSMWSGSVWLLMVPDVGRFGVRTGVAAPVSGVLPHP